MHVRACVRVHVYLMICYRSKVAIDDHNELINYICSFSSPVPWGNLIGVCVFFNLEENFTKSELLKQLGYVPFPIFVKNISTLVKAHHSDRRACSQTDNSFALR